MKSIIQSEKVCFMTADTENLQEHHIFGGSNRKWSERYGLKVWLRVDWHLHDASNYALHRHPGKGLDLELKQLAQEKFEETHTRAEFMSIFGRNWL